MKAKLTSLSVLLFLLVSVSMKPVCVYADTFSLYRAVQVQNTPALDVPYVPTPPEVVNKMLSMAGVNSKDTLYDLGCGDGRIVVTAAKDLNVKRAIGFDIDPARISESNDNAKAAGVSERVAFLQKNLFDVDVSEATVVSLYLLPSVNMMLRPKLLKEMKPGTRIVSHDFDMGDWRPDEEAHIKEHTIYYWVVPASVNGTWNWSIADGTKTQRYELRLAQQFQNVSSAYVKVNDADETVKYVKLSGDKLQFTVKGDAGDIVFQGTIAENAMQGTFSSKDGSKKKWNAKRDPDTVEPLDTSNALHVRI